MAVPDIMKDVWIPRADRGLLKNDVAEFIYISSLRRYKPRTS